jgi:hypothetical protein
MRTFSSAPHAWLIGRAHAGGMNPTPLSRVSLALLLAAVLIGGVVLGSVVTAFGQGVTAPTPTATPTPVPTPSSAGVPDADVDGEDLERLPRYPAAVRTEYEISRDDRFQLTAVEYLADASVEAVRAFYQDVMHEHGWDRADVNYAAGEWTYVLVDGRIEALVEIEEWNGLIEIDLQVSEPIETPRPDRSPAPSPTRAPPPAQPAPPPPSDDGDDDDDDGDDDDDDTGGGTDG